MMSADKELTFDIEADGYRVLALSEGVEAKTRDNQTGLDHMQDDPPLLIVGPKMHEGAVILLKRNSEHSQTYPKYRLFQVKKEKLVELKELRGDWSLNGATGKLIYATIGSSRFNPLNEVVSPDHWGYCLIVEKGWSYIEYKNNLFKAAEVTGLGLIQIVNRLILAQQRAEKAETALQEIADRLRGHDLLDNDYGTPHNKYQQKGHLRAMVNTTEPFQHCTAESFQHCTDGVVLDLRDIYGICQLSLGLPELRDSALKG